MRDLLVCDDPIVERRYAYARAVARDDDWAAAAEVLEQALELAPRARAPANGGGLAFSVETREGEGYRLGPAMRFAHSDRYVREMAIRAGLRRRLLTHVSIRREADLDAPGLLGVYAGK